MELLSFTIIINNVGYNINENLHTVTNTNK